MVQVGERARTPGALPDDQYDVILKHLAGDTLKRSEQKGFVKTALNKCREWNLASGEKKEAAYESSKQRLIYQHTDQNGELELIVMRQSEFAHLVNFFHKEYSGVGAEKLSYLMGQV